MKLRTRLRIRGRLSDSCTTCPYIVDSRHEATNGKQIRACIIKTLLIRIQNDDHDTNSSVT